MLWVSDIVAHLLYKAMVRSDLAHANYRKCGVHIIVWLVLEWMLL